MTDTITFSVTGTINLASALPDLSTNIDIQGPGANLLTVRRVTGGDYRIFTVAISATVGISGLTVSNGVVADTIGTSAAQWILQRRHAHAEQRHPQRQLGLGRLDGGGIFNAGTLTITASTLSGNSAGTVGGGIDNAGTLTINDSTLSGNSAVRDGGGIYNAGHGSRSTPPPSAATRPLSDGGGIESAAR